MFSDFLKRVICSNPEKKKFPTLLVAKIGPFTVNQCVAVLFALLQERWTQHRTKAAAFSPHLSCGSVSSAAQPGPFSVPLCCHCYGGSDYSYLKIENEVILFFWASGVKDWVNCSSQLMARCLYLSEPSPFLLYFSYIVICLFSFGTISLPHLWTQQ